MILRNLQQQSRPILALDRNVNLVVTRKLKQLRGKGVFKSSFTYIISGTYRNRDLPQTFNIYLGCHHIVTVVLSRLCVC